MSHTHPPQPPRGETRFEQVAFFWCALGTLVGAGACIALVYETRGVEGLRGFGSLATLSLLVLGKFVVFSGLHEDSPPPWEVAVLVWWIDLVLAVGLAAGLEPLERAPVMGRWLRRVRLRAVRTLEEYPGLGRMAFFGVVLFVLLPLAATGAISGSIAARLLGLSRVAGVAAIALGSAGIAGLFALLANVVGERAEDLARSPIAVGSLLVVLIVMGRMAYLRILGRLRRR